MIGCSISKSRARSPVVVSSAVLSVNSTEMSWSAAVRAWTELLEHYRLMSLPFTESANHLCKSARATLLASKTSLVVEMGDLAPASHHIVIIQSNFDNIVKCWQWKGAEQHFLITALAFYFIFKNQSKTLECMEQWGERRRDGDCWIQFPCWVDPNMCNCADLNICAMCSTQCAQPTPPAHQDHIVAPVLPSLPLQYSSAIEFKSFGPFGRFEKQSWL